MVSRQETARPLLTAGEIMQLAQEDELVLVSACPPIRARKARYYEDPELSARILPPPSLSPRLPEPAPDDAAANQGDWAGAILAEPSSASAGDAANGGIRREPELPAHEDIAPRPRRPVNEFEPLEDADDEPQRERGVRRAMSAVARQAALDPADEMRL
jgi:type IV secretion system protein VirD4